MITQLTGFRGNVVAVAGTGHVTRGDYKSVLTPAVETALKANKKVRLYYRFGPDFAGIEPGAIWEDFSIGLEHIARWERVAIVTDATWIKLAVAAFAFLIPSKVRVFQIREEGRARAWISER